ncbi:xylulokinase [Reichenbachiella versicolor]|uniref:xylulokinase n=1 Tax=Reichenbachiella versicolor TaxID=1821036 RepID=UPI000D6E5658|nr:FGGY family carbohydrate kinase [Reichenbachiella versicolor]
MYLLGYDLGSSSVKAAIVEAETGKSIAVEQYPSQEMEIISHELGWAEQEPDTWWENLKNVTQNILASSKIDSALIKGIGISYQMHGLVVVDENQNSLRPSIIWCDSRAVEIGNEAFGQIGSEKCLSHLLNSPGNFTASKLKWLKDNEQSTFQKIDKIMLPGDYIAMKMTGEVKTTVTGLSEGIMWDFKEEKIASFLLDHYGIKESMIPEVVDAVGHQGKLTAESAKYLGLNEGIPIGYRAGDQPNNAMSLGVLNPGEVAATGGTSGVVYGVVDKPTVDPKTRVNSFAHVNYTSDDARVGVLLCINGSGIQYSWVRQMVAEEGLDYPDLEKLAAEIPIGSDELRIIPFGNGAERVLENKNLGAQMINLQFNRHKKPHIYRATLEGIAFSFIYGMEIMQDMGLDVGVIKVGNDNLFQSEIFSKTIATVIGCEIQMVKTTGAVGAAKAAGVAGGLYDSLEQAFAQMETVQVYKGDDNGEPYKKAYQLWKQDLEKLL